MPGLVAANDARAAATRRACGNNGGSRATQLHSVSRRTVHASQARRKLREGGTHSCLAVAHRLHFFWKGGGRMSQVMPVTQSAWEAQAARLRRCREKQQYLTARVLAHVRDAAT